MGVSGGFFSRMGEVAGKFFKTYRGPNPRIFVAGKNCLSAFQLYYYERATKIRLGEEIRKKEGDDIAVRTISLADLAAEPLILDLGYLLGLYVVEKGNKRVIVVADLSRAITENMPAPDFYVINEGQYLTVGRNREMDLTVPKYYQGVSNAHLRILFPQPGQQVFIVDFSRNGTIANPLANSIDRERNPDIIPLKIKPYMI